MMDLIKSWGGLVGAVVIIVGALISAFTWVGVPPYTERSDFENLASQVQANTESGWLRQLENALARGDQNEIRRICNIIAKIYGYRAAGCP